MGVGLWLCIEVAATLMLHNVMSESRHSFEFVVLKLTINLGIQRVHCQFLESRERNVLMKFSANYGPFSVRKCDGILYGMI